MRSRLCAPTGWQQASGILPSRISKTPLRPWQSEAASKASIGDEGRLLLGLLALGGDVARGGRVGFAHISALLGRAVALVALVMILVRLGVDPDDCVGRALRLGVGLGAEFA